LSELYGHDHDVVSIFLERPHLRRYFYENKRLDDFVDPVLRSQVRTNCQVECERHCYPSNAMKLRDLWQ
jgi:hypothetical protein